MLRPHTIAGRLIISLFLCFAPTSQYVFAAMPTIVISEIQTGTTNSANEEFVEIYNPAHQAESVEGWQLQYKSATGTSWSTKATLTGSIEPRGFYLVATASYLSDLADANMSNGLASSGGHLRILVPTNDNAAEVVLDLVGWGNADSPEGSAASAPPAGNSLKRQFNSDGEIADTGNNSVDLILSNQPSPESTPSAAPTPEPGDPPNEEPTDFASVEISELLPDPTSPQTDSQDEFIELFNPHAETINLDGYVIKNGSNLQNQFVIINVSLAPGQHKAFYARDGEMTLTNSGGQAQVFAPDGTAASDLVTYETAEAGQSWADIDDVWQWTSVVTPDAANQASPAGLGSGGVPNSSGSNNAAYPKLEVTELYVDPASPLLDSEDEFVEIYNPTDSTVQLDDYTLRTGSNLKTKFNLPEGEIQPGQYIAFYGRDSNISLTNSGGNARLDDANDNKIDETDVYEKAESGDAWAQIDGKWQWTGTPTPNAANLLSVSTKQTKQAKAVAAKSKKVAAKKSSSTKAKSSKDKKVQALAEPAQIPTSPLSLKLVATAASLALLYGLYEFRYDFRNRFELAKRYFTHRWHGGP